MLANWLPTLMFNIPTCLIYATHSTECHTGKAPNFLLANNKAATKWISHVGNTDFYNHNRSKLN